MMNDPNANTLPSQTTAKTVAEFFAGIGLMRMGLEAEGWKVIFANDIAPDKREMYTTHFQDSECHFRLEDISKLVAATFRPS